MKVFKYIYSLFIHLAASIHILFIQTLHEYYLNMLYSALVIVTRKNILKFFLVYIFVSSNHTVVGSIPNSWENFFENSSIIIGY